MNDREITMFAAKAVGYEGLGFWDDKLKCLWDGEGWSFDPLDDDADAFRVCVNLGFCFHADKGPNRSRAVVSLSAKQHVQIDVTDGDLLRASRRAITQLAALIGAGSKESLYI